MKLKRNPQELTFETKQKLFWPEQCPQVYFRKGSLQRQIAQQLLLPDARWCAQCTEGPNKMKDWILE